MVEDSLFKSWITTEITRLAALKDDEIQRSAVGTEICWTTFIRWRCLFQFAVCKMRKWICHIMGMKCIALHAPFTVNKLNRVFKSESVAGKGPTKQQTAMFFHWDLGKKRKTSHSPQVVCLQRSVASAPLSSAFIIIQNHCSALWVNNLLHPKPIWQRQWLIENYLTRTKGRWQRPWWQSC